MLVASVTSLVSVTVSEEIQQKNIRSMDKSLKQLEIDIKNAQQDKTAPANDRFVEVMQISFFQLSECRLQTWCIVSALCWQCRHKWPTLDIIHDILYYDRMASHGNAII